MEFGRRRRYHGEGRGSSGARDSGVGQDSAAGLSRAPWGCQWAPLSAQAGRGEGDGPRSVTLGTARCSPGAPWPLPPGSWGGGLSCPPNPAPPALSSAVRAVPYRPVSPRSQFVPVPGRLDGRKRLSWGKRQSRGPSGVCQPPGASSGVTGIRLSPLPGETAWSVGKKRGVRSPRCSVPGHVGAMRGAGSGAVSEGGQGDMDYGGSVGL